MNHTPPIKLVSLAFAFSAASLHAQTIDYSTAGSSHSENFNSLGTSAGNLSSNLSGWYFVNSSGALDDSYLISDGTSSNQDQPLSIGDDADRALGAQSPSLGGAGYAEMHYGAAISNNTGSTLNSFNLDYTAEIWRDVSGDTNEVITFEYQIFNSGTGSLNAASGWTEVGDLGFTAISGAVSGGKDGNLPENQITVTGSASISWGNGQELWIRWTDINNRPINADAPQRLMIGIDNLTFSAVAIPEPSTASILLGGAALILSSVRRRSK